MRGLTLRVPFKELRLVNSKASPMPDTPPNTDQIPPLFCMSDNTDHTEKGLIEVGNSSGDIVLSSDNGMGGSCQIRRTQSRQ